MFSWLVEMLTLFGISIQLIFFHLFFFKPVLLTSISLLKIWWEPFLFSSFWCFSFFFFFFSFYSFFFFFEFFFKPPHWNKLIKYINRTNRTQGIVKIDWILRKKVAFSKPYKWQLNRKQKKVEKNPYLLNYFLNRFWITCCCRGRTKFPSFHYCRRRTEFVFFFFHFLLDFLFSYACWSKTRYSNRTWK